MRFVKVLLLLAVFVLGLLFFVQNSTELGFVQQDAQSAKTLTLQLDLYFSGLNWKSAAIPLYVVILAAFAVGMLFATTLLFIDRVRNSCALMSQKRSVRMLEKEVARLRSEHGGKTIETKAEEVKQLPSNKGAGATA